MTNKVKTLRGLITGALLLAAGLAQADEGPVISPHRHIYVTVTVDVVSVRVSSNAWAIGQIAPGVNVSSAGIRVTNNGNRQEDYQLGLAEDGGWSVGTTTNPATDTFVMVALFKDAAPAENENGYHSHASNDVITTINQTATADQFALAGDAAGQKGFDVAAGAVRNLNLHFMAPTSNTQTSRQTITVTVTAVAG